MKKSELKKLSRKELEALFLQMPKVEKEKPIYKRMNDINTFHSINNEIYVTGTDEYGKEFCLSFDSYNFLEWIDKDKLEYIKENLIKHLNRE